MPGTRAHRSAPAVDSRLLGRLQFLEDDPEIAARAAAATGNRVAGELLRQLEVHHRLLRRLSHLHRFARMREEDAVEFAEVDEVLPGHHRAVACDHTIDILDAAGGLLVRLAGGNVAAAV